MPVIVISNQTLKGADVAIKALEAGAVDVIAKPNLSNESEVNESRINLIDKIRSAHSAKKLSARTKGTSERTKAEPAKCARLDNPSAGFSQQAIIAIGA